MLTQKSNRMRTMWSHAAEGPAPYQGTIRPEASTFTSWYWIQFGGVSSFLACARAFDAANRVNGKSTAAATNAPGGAKRLDDGMCALLLAVFPPVPRIEIPGKREGFSRHATNSILPSPSGATSGLRRGRRSRSSSWWRAPPLCTKSDGEPQRGELARERLERQRGLRVNSGFADTVGMGLRPAKVDEKLSGRRLADEILWGRLVTCGRLAIGPCRLRGGPAAVTNRRAGCQPAPHWFFAPVNCLTDDLNPSSVPPQACYLCAVSGGAAGCWGIAAPSVRGSEPAKLTPRLASRITASPFPIAPLNPVSGAITWPRRARSCRTASATRVSICTSHPPNVPLVKRAASSAICTFIPKSTTLATNCACACDWFHPPMMPNPIARSSLRMNAGMIVCSG